MLWSSTSHVLVVTSPIFITATRCAVRASATTTFHKAVKSVIGWTPTSTAFTSASITSASSPTAGKAPPSYSSASTASIVTTLAACQISDWRWQGSNNIESSGLGKTHLSNNIGFNRWSLAKTGLLWNGKCQASTTSELRDTKNNNMTVNLREQIHCKMKSFGQPQ